MGWRSEQGSHQRGYRWEINVDKDNLHHTKQWDITAHWLEWQISKTLTISMLMKLQSNKNFVSLLVEMHKDKTTLGDSLAVSYKTRPTFTTWYSNHAVKYLPSYVENFSPHKNMNICIYTGLFITT